MKPEQTFHLGITMAGAVSAGAYTAGFMDYIIEVLELWEDQKSIVRAKLANGEALTKDEKKIPLHDVCIEAIGGASAGGMVSMMTTLATLKGMKPIKFPPKENVKTGNILYDSWVLLDDDLGSGRGLETFEKMLAIDDFEGNPDGIPSLLNSKPIDRIADRVFDELTEDNKRALPNYISSDLRILLTLCSLRGVPFEWKFNNAISSNFSFAPGHRMSEHMIIAHFKMQYDGVKDKDVYLKFDPFDPECKSLMKLCTKATGAFPIGLAPRHFNQVFSKEYIKNCILRNLDIKEDSLKSSIEIKIDEEFFDFTDIDGGTINNEPYLEVLKVLKEKHANYNSEFPNFGTVMIDPFPNFYNQDEAIPVEDTFKGDLFQKSIWSVLPKAYSTFREQVRVKHSESFYGDYLRHMVFPVKWGHNRELNDHPPISCAALGGFGGFFDLEFRKHDFFLGRNNARNFLRAFFMLEYNKDNLHPLFKELSLEAIDLFSREIEGEDGIERTYVPILPDINLIEDKKKGYTNPFYYNYKEFPKIDEEYFDKIKPALKLRIKKMLKYEFNDKLDGYWFIRNSAKILSGYAANKLTKKVINTIKSDFRNRKMMS